MFSLSEMLLNSGFFWFSDASVSLLFLYLYACQYLHGCVCVCEGGFISSRRWPQPLIHRSSEMKSPRKSEGREERNGQTHIEWESEGAMIRRKSERMTGGRGGNEERGVMTTKRVSLQELLSGVVLPVILYLHSDLSILETYFWFFSIKL